MKLRELDVSQELTCLHDVWETTERIVEVLECRSKIKKVRNLELSLPLENDFTITDLVFEELIELNKGKFFG
jgi:hypothetical protein